jgi:hypothetical protein
VDRKVLAYFPRARPGELAAPGESGDHAAPVMTHMIERLSDYPALVFSRSGEVLAQTRPAIALFGDCTRFGGSSRHLVEGWLTDLAAREHELYRLLLVDPVEFQMLLVFTAVPASPREEKLRRMVAADG